MKIDYFVGITNELKIKVSTLAWKATMAEENPVVAESKLTNLLADIETLKTTFGVLGTRIFNEKIVNVF